MLHKKLEISNISSVAKKGDIIAPSQVNPVVFVSDEDCFGSSYSEDTIKSVLLSLR